MGEGKRTFWQEIEEEVEKDFEKAEQTLENVEHTVGSAFHIPQLPDLLRLGFISFVLRLSISGIYTMLAADGLSDALFQLNYGPDIQKQVKEILIRVNTLQLARDRYTPQFCDVLDRIRQHCVKLEGDIQKYYKKANH